MKKRVYFIDFDHTLFDTDRFFRVDFKDFLLGWGIDEELWDKSYKVTRNMGYALEKHILEAQKLGDLDLNIQKFKDILEKEFSDLSKYLYPDVIEFLKKAKRSGATLYLLSFGDPSWQHYKVKSSGIANYFAEKFYQTKEGTKADKILEFRDKFGEIIYIDDREQEIDLVKKKIPEVKTYLIDRKNNNSFATRSLQEIN